MLIGVISDTHDNLDAIRTALDLFRREQVEMIVHAGDFVAPFALKLFVEQPLPLVAVLGNNDGERKGLTKMTPDLHKPPFETEVGGRKLVLTHEKERLTDDLTDNADLVVFGHTHGCELKHAGDTLWLNPGEAGGWLSGQGTVAFVELDDMSARIVDIDTGETVLS